MFANAAEIEMLLNYLNADGFDALLCILHSFFVRLNGL